MVCGLRYAVGKVIYQDPSPRVGFIGTTLTPGQTQWQKELSEFPGTDTVYCS